MELNLKEIFEYVGIDGVDIEKGSLDEFKSAFDKKYINRDNVIEDAEIKSKITGSFYGGLNTLAKRTFGLDGSDFEYEENGEKKKKDFGQVLEVIKSRQDAKIAELNKVIDSSNNDEKYSNLKKDFDDRAKAIEELNAKNENLLTEIEKKEKNYQNEISTYKINHVLGTVKQKLPFKSDITEAERSGFDALINTKYKVGFEQDGDNEVFRIRDINGSLIPDPKKSGQNLDVETVLKSLAEENKLLKVSNGGNGGNAGKLPNPDKPEGGEPKLSYVQQQIRDKALKHGEELERKAQ